MKLLFTHGYFLQEDPKEQAIMRPYVPLGILYISAWMEREGYPNEVFDSTFSSIQALQERILSVRPNILAIYTNLMTKLNVLRIISWVRSRPELEQVRIVLGGPEVRNHARKFLEHGADYIVFGEGELSFQELTEVLDGKQHKPLHDIQGLAFLNPDGSLHMGAERTKIKDLDVLPLPNRQKVDLNLYFRAWKEKHGTSAISVNTMRGCPYTCKWCSRAVYGQSYRRRSPEKVVEELLWIKANYEVDSVWFVDDVFTVSHQWLERFAELVKASGLQLPYECITRADRMNEQVIRLLKESGCFRVWIGAESGSQQVIDRMDRRVEVTQVRSMIQAARKAGIQAGTFIMVGYPGETEEDILETTRHLVVSDPDLYTITVAYPITGTALYQEVEADIIDRPEWQSSTDRDLDFKRSYSRRYYDYAVRMIYNEVAYHKALQKSSVKAPMFKTKALLARLGMLLNR